MNIISANLNFYLRHVDHILPDFDKEQNSLNIFNFLNKRHPNIKFVIQKKKLIIPSFFLMYLFQQCKFLALLAHAVSYYKIEFPIVM